MSIFSCSSSRPSDMGGGVSLLVKDMQDIINDLVQENLRLRAQDDREDLIRIIESMADSVRMVFLRYEDDCQKMENEISYLKEEIKNANHRERNDSSAFYGSSSDAERSSADDVPSWIR